MLDGTRARLAFEHCPNRSEAPALSGSRSHRQFTCAQLPEGKEVHEAALKFMGGRKQLAVELGCLACPYRNEPTETVPPETVPPTGETAPDA